MFVLYSLSSLKLNSHEISLFPITRGRYEIPFVVSQAVLYILRILNVDTRKSWGWNGFAIVANLTTAVLVNSSVARFNVAQQGRRRVAVNRNQFNAACMLQLRNEFAKCGAAPSVLFTRMRSSKSKDNREKGRRMRKT